MYCVSKLIFILTLSHIIYEISARKQSSSKQLSYPNTAADYEYADDNTAKFTDPIIVPVYTKPLSSKQTWSFEADVPALIRQFLGLPQKAEVVRSQIDDGVNQVNDQKIRVQIQTPDWNVLLNNIKDIFSRRLNLDDSYVEEGHGAFKSAIVEYPKNHHEDSLKKLMKLKERAAGLLG